MMSHDSRPPLRLLLVTDGTTIPNWLFTCLDALERSNAAKVVFLVPAFERSRGLGRVLARLRQVLFVLHQRLDRALFRRVPDALAPISLAALPECRLLDGAALGNGRPGSRPGNGRWERTLRDAGIDLVLDPFALVPDGRLANLAKYGVWSTTVGQSGDARTQFSPAFWEVVEGRPSTEARVWIRGRADTGQRLVYASVVPTDRRSVSRNQNHVYWKISAALSTQLRKLRDDRDGFPQQLTTAAPFEIATGLSRPPGNWEMLQACTALARRYVSDKWASTLYREQWALALHRGVGERPGVAAFNKVIPPGDRFWADPFPVRVGNAYYIFHEELLFSSNKGRIVLTVVDDTGTIAPPTPILERAYHLSYPFVFQWDGEFFMIPETGAHAQVELYRCLAFPARWKLERVLLSGVRAFDPTPALLFGKWWLFTSIPAYGVTGTSDDLHLFYADSPLGPWTPHRNNPIKSDVRSARPAGRIFERHGQFYRPAQDCSHHYGYAVSINRIVRLDLDAYEEVEVDRILPDGSARVAGVHTLNTAGDLTVIDCLMRRQRRARVTVQPSSPTDRGVPRQPRPQGL